MEAGGFAQNGRLAPLAIPEEDEDEATIDTQFIHWGYINCCQTISKGKKVKKQAWTTYWLELCGSTLRFYRDSSLHIDSSLHPPPSSPSCISQENEIKVAFFDLRNADVKLLSDGNLPQSFHKKSKSKRSAAPKVFRRHLFQLKLRPLNTTFVFQAPSHSAMLRWVSKIQESLDAYEYVEKSDSAERRLKLARSFMRKKSKPLKEVVLDECDGDDGLIEAGSNIPKPAAEALRINPSLKNLKNSLATKYEQLLQFEMQIIDFLGRGKGAFKRDEFECATKQDYFLVPGQIETFIPAGTMVTIFGQLPNRRWRCFIEREKLLKSINLQINTLKSKTKSDSDTFHKPENEYSVRDIEMLTTLCSSLPEYPLIGCLPTSILNTELSKEDTPLMKENVMPAQHARSSIEITLSEFITDSDQDSVDDGCTDSDTISVGDLKVASPGHSESGSASEAENDFNENVKLRKFGSGIVIRKKLRQKGISIIVGSSSSEGEDY